jgi:hypothetical protein
MIKSVIFSLVDTQISNNIVNTADLMTKFGQKGVYLLNISNISKDSKCMVNFNHCSIEIDKNLQCQISATLLLITEISALTTKYDKIIQEN